MITPAQPTTARRFGPKNYILISTPQPAKRRQRLSWFCEQTLFLLALPFLLALCVVLGVQHRIARLDGRQIDRAATFAVGWVMILAALYLGFCIFIAFANHRFPMGGR